MGKRDTGDRTVTGICYAIFRHARWCDPSEEPHALARTCGSVRGARGNPGPYRDLNLLCRLAAGKHRPVTIVPGGTAIYEELVERCDSSLEREWLAFLQDGGYQLPDRAQVYLKEFGTRPDFVYSSYQTVVYIDGPQHHTKRVKQKDEEITRRLQDGGYTVVRFGINRKEWGNLVREFAWLFGERATSSV